MSDDYHRPTLTFPKGAYNATQVRLYGITPKSDLLKHIDANNIESTNKKIRIKTDVTKTDLVVIDTKSKIGIVFILAATWDDDNPISCGVIVGYSYEGHCYDLPKPKLMLIPASPRSIPTDDCGYDLKEDPDTKEKYKLWIVDKLDQCVEFEVNQGFVEQIVLEANLPGKRSPTMYASKMTMGHRGGKLND
ncbi:hypothetical protein [Mesorhizobium australafricanum]|uniref:Uncharacterized protein n=1 Tax=Mesorhizobium australafricanum TaxID=3072311 RepID=A0ABU4X700_9HYPH|nr:hypothetical protein [Mesorhizobium sp. VK3E]MDX8443288.1 hypothetical protein [Mesorhizobium sp. VK3E]